MPEKKLTAGKNAGQASAPSQRRQTIRTMPITMAIAGKTGTARGGALDSAELQLVDRTARRLHEAIRAFLSACPEDAQNASGLARLLGIDRTTCQRAVYATGSPYSGPTIIERLPGVKGLRAMVEAARERSDEIAPDPIDRLEAAVDQFAQTLDRVAGSVSELLRRVDATPQIPENGSGAGRTPARERLFTSAAEITGRCSECWIAVYVYHPDPEKSGILHLDRVNGLAGHVARPDAVPLTFHSFSSTKRADDEGVVEPGHFRPLVQEDSPGSPATVLREFSSSPLPVVSTRQPNEFMVQAIDADPDTVGHPVDLMFGTRGTIEHPRTQKPPMEEAWALVNFPVRAMLFDVYLHRDLARECIPSLDAHLWRPDFAQQVGDRWQTRFSDAPKLQVLGTGLTNAASPYHSRHAELSRFLFNQIGMDPSLFVGYRCEVEYPMWRTGYCIGLDFAAPSAG